MMHGRGGLSSHLYDFARTCECLLTGLDRCVDCPLAEGNDSGNRSHSSPKTTRRSSAIRDAILNSAGIKYGVPLIQGYCGQAHQTMGGRGVQLASRPIPNTHRMIDLSCLKKRKRVMRKPVSREPGAPQQQQFQVDIAVFIGKEDILPSVAPLPDVISHSRHHYSSCS